MQLGITISCFKFTIVIPCIPQIYDFNDDDEIDRTDLDELVNRVTGFRMKTEDVDGIVDEILKECDMDENG